MSCTSLGADVALLLLELQSTARARPVLLCPNHIPRASLQRCCICNASRHDRKYRSAQSIVHTPPPADPFTDQAPPLPARRPCAAASRCISAQVCSFSCHVSPRTAVAARRCRHVLSQHPFACKSVPNARLSIVSSSPQACRAFVHALCCCVVHSRVPRVLPAHRGGLVAPLTESRPVVAY